MRLPVAANSALASAGVAGGTPGSPMPPIFAPLSPREVEILDNIARGMTNKQVAYALSISEQTVKNHFTSVLRKLEAEDRVGAILHAVKHGWVEIGPPNARTDVRWLLAHPVQPAAQPAATRVSA